MISVNSGERPDGISMFQKLPRGLPLWPPFWLFVPCNFLRNSDTYPHIQGNSPLVFALFSYPILSVYPQGIVYRGFFFHRYRKLFPDRRLLILASALVFGYGHVIYDEPATVGLTMVGDCLCLDLFSYRFAHCLMGRAYSLWRFPFCDRPVEVLLSLGVAGTPFNTPGGLPACCGQAAPPRGASQSLRSFKGAIMSSFSFMRFPSAEFLSR